MMKNKNDSIMHLLPRVTQPLGLPSLCLHELSNVHFCLTFPVASSQVIFNNRELQPTTTMYCQCTVNKTREYLTTVPFVLSLLEIIFYEQS